MVGGTNGLEVFGFFMFFQKKKRRNKINLILFFYFLKNKKVRNFFIILSNVAFLYINYYEIKGWEAHVAWVISAMWIFNNILIFLLATSTFSVS